MEKNLTFEFDAKLQGATPILTHNADVYDVIFDS